MYLVDPNYRKCATFISAGTFINDGPWIHEERIIDSYEVLNPIESTLFIECNAVSYAVAPGEILIIPPGVHHRGTKYSNKQIRFHWFHFVSDPFRLQSEDQVIEKIEQENTDQMIILPLYTDKIDCQRIHVMFNQLLDLYQQQMNKNYLDSFLSCLLYELTAETIRSLIYKKNNRSDLQPVQDWIRIHSFENISLEKIADYFNYNKCYLSRKYKKSFGMNIFDQIITFRLRRAKDLLSETDLNIVQIAAEVGYEDSKYFMRIFKKHEGITPSQYRKTFSQRHYNKV